jgi:hypothetical protein
MKTPLVWDRLDEPEHGEVCKGCGKWIDPTTCGCGGERGNCDGHSFVPIGCDCYRVPNRVVDVPDEGPF